VSEPRSLFVRLFLAVLVTVLAIWMSFVVAIVDSGRREEAQHADAIVVLGAAQYEGRPSPVLKARLDHAAALWARGLAPMMIVTGGRGVGDTTSEAAVGRHYLVQHGVPADSIALDIEGLTTSQSMLAVRRVLGREAYPAVILVSDPFHMLRLAILPISTRPWQQLRYVLAESIKAPYALVVGAH